jgi:hypothetical protein
MSRGSSLNILFFSAPCGTDGSRTAGNTLDWARAKEEKRNRRTTAGNSLIFVSLGKEKGTLKCLHE